ncbi:replication endonuclease [Erwinia tracheiphila]|uniref:Replication endonuclease n=1 Tax=Erwinia tracheiphila TaxID=65700 RepID=A0A345CPF4_9GAMM|nr:replication endonuclease [Erwinia tracheiphila]AXF75321.1 replication endonuclease [Erwinia tracheiphila]UIA82134.1 replication endonuclease [Erwinia tracheiphila]UIA90728.1 replication endonuclease [Erwinia tracheiphila]
MHERGRYAPSPPPPYPGKAPEPAGIWWWNQPRKAIGTVAADPPVADWAFELCLTKAPPDPVQRARRRLSKLPHSIRRWYVQRVDDLTRTKGAIRAGAWLTGTFEKYVLPRIDNVNARYRLDILPLAFGEFAQDYNRLPWCGRRQLKRLAHRLADLVISEFINYQEHYYRETSDLSFSVICAYGRAAWLVSHLNMFAPGWGAYCNEELSDADALRCAARLESPSWWLRRLRRVHDQWREHLQIAAGYVNKKSASYCSEPTLKEWHAQKKSNREYLKAMELEDQDTGERTSLEDKVNKSVANPANRRRELMTRQRGFEDIANEMGLAGEFYTLTAPSRFHAVHTSGRRNDKWTAGAVSPRNTQRYLCKIWARVRAAWRRVGIRVFGFRVAEPHHDGTPHWHLLLFMHPEHVDAARDIFCYHARLEDSEELLTPQALEARFQAKPIDQSLGSATGYIAKYISKNIDGYALDDETDDETGEPLKDTARRVSTWASRWRIRQFQQIGGAPVTVYRELRRMRDRDLCLHPEISPVHEAADAGEWGAYVMAQGGPLVTRDAIPVRLNYEITENGNTWGDDVARVAGVWAPAAGPDSLIYTRTTTYKIVPRAKSEGVDLDLSVDPGRVAAPTWSSVNNCTPTDCSDPAAAPFVGDYDWMTRQERRDLINRIRKRGTGRGNVVKKAHSPPAPPPLTNTLRRDLDRLGINSDYEQLALRRGSGVPYGRGLLHITVSGELSVKRIARYCQAPGCCAELTTPDFLTGHDGWCLKCTEKMREKFMSGRYGDEDDREAEYQHWRYYSESAWEERVEQAEKLKQRIGPAAPTDCSPEPVLFPVKPPEGPLPVMKVRPVFSAYPRHAALIAETERKYSESRQHRAEPEKKESDD